MSVDDKITQTVTATSPDDPSITYDVDVDVKTKNMWAVRMIARLPWWLVSRFPRPVFTVLLWPARAIVTLPSGKVLDTAKFHATVDRDAGTINVFARLRDFRGEELVDRSDVPLLGVVHPRTTSIPGEQGSA